jgi:hypothetical protein
VTDGRTTQTGFEVPSQCRQDFAAKFGWVIGEQFPVRRLLADTLPNLEFVEKLQTDVPVVVM